ncbi:MAG: D-alanine--D-alanine ligase family protein [Silvibacterium sp.]
MKKLRIGVLFGGRSGEHEVSLLSAASVLKAIDRKKYEIVPIGITKEGQWVTASDAHRLLTGESAPPERHLRAGDPETTSTAAVLARGESVIVPPVPSSDQTGALVPFETHASTLARQTHVLNLDVIFPVLHGTFGEDGTIQGLFELAGIAYVGSGVLGSATGMDKDIMKRLFAAAKLPIPRHVSFLRAEWEASPKKTLARIEAALKFPLFVKPANLGSSVGITKAHDRKELTPAIDLAASYDRKIVVEQAVGGRRGKARELEVAILGNDNPEASVVGEIIPGKEFYDYEAKYLTEGSNLILPAKITRTQTKQIQQMAIAAFRACDCSGLARVDFLMDPGKSQRIYLNEINTLPGFTSISMYPKLWAASGVAYADLIDRLIQLALERRAEKDRTSYSR